MEGRIFWTALGKAVGTAPLLCTLALAACGGGGGGGGDSGGGSGGSGGSASAPTYVVRGTISGLLGSGLVLQNNGGDNLAVAGAASSFQFATALADQAAYSVSVLTHPSAPSQTCGVTNGTGTIGGASVTNVQISCATNGYLVGGTVTGLTGSGLVLQLNGANNLAVTSATPNFSFPTAVPSGSVYTVSVSSQPVGQTCGVTNGSGTLGGANVNNVIVACTTSVSSSTYSVSASVTGLTGSGLALRLSGGSPVSVASDGTVALGTGIADATVYSIAVSTQPSSPSQTCTVANSSGTVSGANVTVAVTCATNVYTVGGTVSGLAGSGLQLQLNGGDNLSVTANGSFTFASAIADGSVYAVTVRTQPTSRSQTCTVTQSSSAVSGGDVTTVQVNCTTNSFPVFVSVNGLSGAGLVLQNNGGPGLAISANGSFAFSNSVLSGSSYQVTVATQPSSPSQACTLTNGTGTVGNGSVTNVVVNCATNTYAVGGTVAGLTGTGLVLQLNGSTNLPVGGNGSFAFNPIADASAYAVTVATQPSLQTCTVTNGTGTLGGAAVTSVAVNCSDVKWSGIKEFGSSGDDVANAVALDPRNNGHLVVVGCSQGALTGTYKNTCDAPGGNAYVYVRKYERSGALRWEASFGTSVNNQANAVTIDGSGNIYVTGNSQGNLDGQSGLNGDDVFLTKFDELGNKLWTRVFGSLSADRGNAVALDGSGNLYIAGTTFANLDGAHAGGDYDAFVAKFSAAQIAQVGGPTLAPTIFQFGSTHGDFAWGLAADNTGLYVSGTTDGQIGATANAGSSDVFVSKLGFNGTVLWTQQVGTFDDDRNAGVAVVGGKVYVAGHTGGLITGAAATRLNDIFLVTYDATSGNELGRQQLRSHLHDRATGVTVDSGGNVFVTGYTGGDFGEGGSVGNNADPSNNTTDVFLVKYNSAGVIQWTREVGTNTDDRAYAVATDADGAAFVAGYTLGALEGNTNTGGADMFIIKYDAAGIRQ